MGAGKDIWRFIAPQNNSEQRAGVGIVRCIGDTCLAGNKAELFLALYKSVASGAKINIKMNIFIILGKEGLFSVT